MLLSFCKSLSSFAKHHNGKVAQSINQTDFVCVFYVILFANFLSLLFICLEKYAMLSCFFNPEFCYSQYVFPFVQADDKISSRIFQNA